MDGGRVVTAPAHAWRADRVAVYTWLLLLAITVVSVIASSYTRNWDYEPAVVMFCAGLKFWLITFKFMTNRGSAPWLRAALGAYALLLVVALTAPYFV